MISVIWRKRLSILQNRLYLYPSPEPMPRTRQFWIAIGLVTVAVILFCSYFMLYLTTRHDVLLTSAEDLGIMDQAIWNAIHGNGLRQTICNILHDTNCYSSGVPRFAIHVEPILFPVSLLYLFVPGPKTLLIVQTLVVALGAYPAFLLARLRLRNNMAGVAFALLYLLYPAQQQATVYDFHAATFTTSLMLFTLYFMYTRQTVLLFIFAILSMLCKEQIPFVIIMLGLWSMVFQQRWRVGLALVLLGVIWFGLVFYLIMPGASPTGKPLLISRFDALGDSPGEVVFNIVRHPRSFLMDHVFEHDHMTYLRSLLAPAAYLPLLAPWILIIALPTIALNLISANVQQYSGLYQYNAEIVPVLIFATVEAIVLILWIFQVIIARLNAWREQTQSGLHSFFSRLVVFRRFAHVGLLTMLLCIVLFSVNRSDYYFHGHMPYSQGFRWPQATTHTALAQRFFDMIPPGTSVSAQMMLVPHLSQRQFIYQFPYGVPLSYPVYAHPGKDADYVLLDVTGDIYPYYSTIDFVRDVKSLLVSGQYGIVAAQDGFLLLKRGAPSPGLSPLSAVKPGPEVNNALVSPSFPNDFCSYTYVSPQEVTNSLRATFTDTKGSMDLVGFKMNGSSTFSRSSSYMSVTTFWQVSKPVSSPLQILFLLRDENGKEYYANNDVPALFWCQTQTWEPGKIVKVTTRLFNLKELPAPNGLAQMSVALVPMMQPSGKIVDMQSQLMNIQMRLPVHVGNGSDTVSATQDTNALPLAPMTIVP